MKFAQSRVATAAVGFVLAFASACSDTEIESPAGIDRSTAVSDIRLLSSREDGRFDVICKDGTTEIRTAEEILDNQVCEGQPSGEAFICASRYSNGFAPWALARIADGGPEMFTSAIYQSVDECRSAIEAQAVHGAGTYLCASRYSNGFAPWMVSYVDADGIESLTRLVFQTLDSCNEAVSESSDVEESLYLCASQYQNGFAPWSMYSVANGDATRTSANYNSFEQCVSDVASIDGGLQCVSRYNNGFAPWAIARRSPDGLTRFDAAVHQEIELCNSSIEFRVALSEELEWTCASRYGNGHAPFALFSLAGDGRMEATVYSTIDECLTASGAVLPGDGTGTVCASTYGNGFAPWSLWTLSENAAQRSNLTYSSLESCVGSLAP
ncbi:MAG: hypothetical protein AAF654_11460 [Myxococcota bacterium]